MNKPQILHSLSEKLNRLQTSEDPFFGRGRLATHLQKQALTLAYFSQVKYEEALKQIHDDFCIPGQPYSQKVDTTPAHTDLQVITKHFEDTCEGSRRLQMDTMWWVEESGSLLLKPGIPDVVCFESVNLHSGRILYNHELEGISHGFRHFLVKEDYWTFMYLVEGIRKRIS
jgi:hypothetical protein